MLASWLCQPYSISSKFRRFSGFSVDFSLKKYFFTNKEKLLKYLCVYLLRFRREYPCEHYTSVITVTLVGAGCPRADVQTTALHLLQILDKRFFGTVGLLHGEKEKGMCKINFDRRIFFFKHLSFIFVYLQSSFVLHWSIILHNF